MAEPHPYETACVVMQPDGRMRAEDFHVFRAQDMPHAALAARQYHERVYGKRFPVARVRVYHSCDTCPRAESQYTDAYGVACCKYRVHGDCAYAGTHTEYACSLI